MLSKISNLLVNLRYLIKIINCIRYVNFFFFFIFDTLLYKTPLLQKTLFFNYLNIKKKGLTQFMK
jgi:hypothetical protein